MATAQRLAVDANGRFDLRPRSPTPRHWRRTICAGTRRRATRSTTRSRRAGGALRAAAGNRREPVLDAGCAQPDPLRRDAPRPRRASSSTAPSATGWSSTCARWTMLTSTAGRGGGASRTAVIRCPSTWPPGWAWAATSPTRCLPALRRLRRQRSRSRTAMSPCPTRRASASS